MKARAFYELVKLLHDLMEGIKIYPTYKDGADYWITLQKGELLLYIWFRRYLLL